MTPILECRNLTKRYGNKVALDHIQFSLERGKIIGFLGPNGSGCLLYTSDAADEL